MCAPINSRGSMILDMGRALRELSPVNPDVKSCAARTPASIRIVEPLLPQSNEVGDCFSRVLPSILTLFPCRATRTPNCCKQERVEPQSTADEKLENLDTPEAS